MREKGDVFQGNIGRIDTSKHPVNRVHSCRCFGDVDLARVLVEDANVSKSAANVTGNANRLPS